MINEVRTYTVPGDPTAIRRSRTARGRLYDSQKEFQLWMGITIKNQHDIDDLFEGPLHIFIRFFMPIPPGKKRNPEQWHHSKPQLDQLIKILFDTCNTILFHDDSCISSINCAKLYDKNPRTEFVISQLQKSHEKNSL